jgi:adenylylsulfate kinase
MGIERSTKTGSHLSPNSSLVKGTSTMPKGFTVRFTGLSGAGKTTIAGELERVLRARGHRVEMLDGDVVRTNLSKGLGFSREDRDTNIRRIGFVSKLLSRNGVAVITAAISPYREVRDEVRGEIERFVEVFVKCPLDELVRRDVKGLYAKALCGEIGNFTGVSDPYEEPLDPEVVVETDRETIEESVGKVVATLERLGYLEPVPSGEVARV